jgi:hypothetical protein
MKKLFVILYFFPFWGLGGLSSFAQSSVTVNPVTADYSANPPTVTFKVSWPAGTRDADHRSKVWLLVDYRRIQNNAYTGSWLRAGISTAQTPTANAGSVLLESGNDRGFWLQGTDDAFAATVTVPVAVDLTGYAPQFGWCGVASDRPPTAVEHSGYYTLRGTQPFIIQTVPGDPGSTISRSAATYDNCIYGLTDATGCPGEVPPMPAIINLSATSICAGQGATLTATAGGGTTTAMTYTWIVGNGAAQTTTTGSLSLLSVAEGGNTYSVTVTNANGCTSAAETDAITVHTAVATASISGSSSNTCPDATVALTASATGATSFTWYQNGSPVQSGTSTAYTVTSSGSYTVQGKNANCTGITSPSHVVTINGCNEVPGCAGLKLYQTTNIFDGYRNWGEANEYCTKLGARLPTRTELQCMCENKSSTPGATYTGYTYWSSTKHSNTFYYTVHFGDCGLSNLSDGYNTAFRCVL